MVSLPRNPQPVKLDVPTFVRAGGRFWHLQAFAGRDPGGTTYRLKTLGGNAVNWVYAAPEAAILRCDCPDWRERRQCGHVDTLVDQGLIELPGLNDDPLRGWDATLDVEEDMFPQVEPGDLTAYFQSVRDHFRSLDNPAADLVAAHLGDLVNEAIALGRPADAETFEDRRAAMLGYTGD